MNPLFTVHAGEYLVGSHIERTFKTVNVWVPTRDSGVDLLVSDRRNRRSVSLQVKFSRDFLVTHMAPAYRQKLSACGWWSIDREKLRTSPADYWVLVLQGFASRSTDFIVIPPSVLLKSLEALHGRIKRLQSYIWVTQAGECWETRGLPKTDQMLVAQGEFVDRRRNFGKWLSNWTPIARLSE